MLEIDSLHQITFDNLKNAIDNTISNKIFVRNCILEDMPNITKDDQLIKINSIFFSPSSHMLIKTTNHIEWTPVKLYLNAYYVVNLYGNFWIISNSSYNGFVVKSYIKYIQYIDILFESIKNMNILSLPQNYWCSYHELSSGMQVLENDISKNIILIKEMKFINSPIIIHHYLYKNNNKYYYFPYSNNCVYKPILYK
jgi:hypothetical protein